MVIAVENSIFYVDPVTDKVSMEEEPIQLEVWGCLHCGHTNLTWEEKERHIKADGRCDYL